MEVVPQGIRRRRARVVRVSEEEIVCMLRAYLANPSRWRAIIADIRANFYQLNEDTRRLYEVSSARQLRDRLSSKLSGLLAKDPDTISNVQIRDLVIQVRGLEGHLVDRRDVMHEAQEHPVGRQNPQPLPGPARPRVDIRAVALVAMIAAQLPPLSLPLPHKHRDRRMWKLMRENHLMYNKFMRKTMPKILRKIGISSSEESS